MDPMIHLRNIYIMFANVAYLYKDRSSFSKNSTSYKFTNAYRMKKNIVA